jgi:hypothetical protein
MDTVINIIARAERAYLSCRALKWVSRKGSGCRLSSMSRPCSVIALLGGPMVWKSRAPGKGGSSPGGPQGLWDEQSSCMSQVRWCGQQRWCSPMPLTSLDGVGRAWGELRGIVSRVMRGRQYRIRTITMTAAVFGSFAMECCSVEPQ